MKFPDEMLLKLSKLGKNIDRISGQMLEDAAEIIQEEAEKNLQAVIGSNTKHKSRSTGKLLRFVKATKAYKIENGRSHIRIGIWGYYYVNGRKIPAPLVANVFEFGRKNGKLPHAKKWLRPAFRKKRQACIAAMQKRLDEEAAKL